MVAVPLKAACPVSGSDLQYSPAQGRAQALLHRHYTQLPFGVLFSKLEGSNLKGQEEPAGLALGLAFATADIWLKYPQWD